MNAKLLPLLMVVLFCSYCSAPRNIIHSGKVTPKGTFKAGVNAGYNIPTSTMSALFGGMEEGVDAIINQDTIKIDSSFNSFVKALTMFSIDPVGANTDFYIRYGLIKRMDIGYSRNSGVNVFDVRYQFMGSTGSFKNPSNAKFYGSAGIQYSGQEYELPSFLGKLQSALKYKLERKDILIPVAFSRSFGEEEKTGAFGFGALYGLTLLTYDYEPNIVYELVSSVYQPVTEVPRGKNNFSSFGVFTNVKLGYKYVYGLASLALYYQDYGTYNLFKNEKASFKGVSVIPSLGVQCAF